MYLRDVNRLFKLLLESALAVAQKHEESTAIAQIEVHDRYIIVQSVVYRLVSSCG